MDTPATTADTTPARDATRPLDAPLCERCGHDHVPAERHGVAGVFHRCPVNGCYCRKFVLAIRRPSEDTCQRCGGPNVVWFAPNYVWNEVVRDDTNFLCPTCFIVLAELAGRQLIWRVAPDDCSPANDMLRSRAALQMLAPYYADDLVTLYHGDCRDVLAVVGPSVLVSDPPYPNKAGHFDDAVAVAREVVALPYLHAFVFWHELEVPPSASPLVALHVWHRTNTNRPDNYEAVFEFAPDGRKRASRVFPYPVIYPGLTGCYEANGHPTQKPVDLMRALIARCPAGLVFDPFMGSGTTIRAAKDLGRPVVGCEQSERWCEVAAERCRQEVLNLGGAA